LPKFLTDVLACLKFPNADQFIYLFYYFCSNITASGLTVPVQKISNLGVFEFLTCC
jgi:hypothetical protein